MKLYWRVKDERTKKWTWRAAKVREIGGVLYTRPGEYE